MRPLFGCNQYIPSEALGKAVLISWQLLPFLNKKSTFIYFFSSSERQCTHDRNCDYHSLGKIKVHKQLNSYQSILATAIGLGRQCCVIAGWRNSLTAFSLLAKCKGIRDLGKLSWWHQESWALESGIRLKESGIPRTIRIQNPRSTEKEWKSST